MAKKGIIERFKQHSEDYLREFVYGGMDGAVTTFAVVTGAAGANLGIKVILILGYANVLADGFSMTVTDGPCSDGMSDAHWADRVALSFGEGTLKGCGGVREDF